MNKNLFLAVFILMAALVTSGCGEGKQEESSKSNQAQKEENQQELNKQELKNPASVYCVEHGGKLEIRSNKFGEVGYCVFDDGSECEEWSFYQGECQKGEKKGEEKENKDNEKNNSSQ